MKNIVETINGKGYVRFEMSFPVSSRNVSRMELLEVRIKVAGGFVSSAKHIRTGWLSDDSAEIVYYIPEDKAVLFNINN